jgi:hypothetical protein
LELLHCRPWCVCEIAMGFWVFGERARELGESRAGVEMSAWKGGLITGGPSYSQPPNS